MILSLYELSDLYIICSGDDLGSCSQAIWMEKEGSLCRGSMNLNVSSTREIDDMISDIGKLRALGALRRDFFFPA